MLSPLMRALTSRYAGPAASATALVLAALLAFTWISADRSQSALQAQVAELTRKNRQVVSEWSLKAAASDSAAAAQQGRAMAATTDDAAPDPKVDRLLKQAPAGIDLCARMESADRAVLETLR
jgi:hypothetical protein